MLQIALPKKLVDKIITFKHRTSEDRDIVVKTSNKEYKYPSDLLDAVRQDPSQFSNINICQSWESYDLVDSLDNLEFVMNINSAVALNPQSGIKIVPFDVAAYAPKGSAPRIAYEKYRANLDKLVTDIANDIKNGVKE